jgi:hypothetical protein
MRNLLGKLIRYLHKKAFLDLGRDHRSAILLAGTGRSGTTWVSEIINARNEYRYMFEPFYPYRVNLIEEFGYRQYLRPDSERPLFKKQVEAILRGSIRDIWIDQFNSRFISTKRLIKTIRGHLFLKWVHVNFPGVPIVLLLRHPCAVALSKVKQGWSAHLSVFLKQNSLQEDFLGPYIEELRSAETDFERHLLFWCIENALPLRQFNRGEICVVFYEELCTAPMKEIGKLYEFLDMPFEESIVSSVLKKPVQTRPGSAILTGANLTREWQKQITAEEVERALELLELFELDCIYTSKPTPDLSGLDAVMGSTR